MIIMNCCGNDLCENGESFGNCPGDCLPEKLDFELLSSLEENFFRGESVLFKVKISAEDRKILSADTKLSGFFGEITLYNDGRHEDGDMFDAIYANRFFIDSTTEEGLHSVNLHAVFREVSTEQDYSLFVDPKLDVVLDVKEKYYLGDIIDLSGVIKKKNYRFSVPLNIKIESKRKMVLDLDTSSDSDGLFSEQYHSSLIDSSGTWLITVEGIDSNNNRAFLQKEIEVSQPGETAFLSIELLNELKEEYERYSAIEIIAIVKDVADSTVENALVKLIGPLNEEIQLLELLPGKYSGVYHIPWDLALGEQSLELVATKGGESPMAGSNNFLFSVRKAKIDIEIIEPSKRRYQIGENLSPTVFLSYPSGEPVVNADARALIQNKEIKLHSIEAGIFSANYFFSEQDRGRLKISFKAIDAVDNEGFAETKVEVSGTSLLYLIQKNSLLIAIVLIAAIALVTIARGFLLKKITLKSLLRRRNELTSLEKELQSKYFEQNAISKEDYKKLAEKYESELEDVERKIGELKKDGKKGK